jgi:hypothetical protein
MSRHFLGTCDRVRRTDEGEEFWQAMMADRVEISEAEFLNAVIISDMLDEGETFDDFTTVAEMEGEPCRFFKTGETFHIQQAGFEWIFF